MGRRSGLGRGLGALIPTTAEPLEGGPSQFREIPVGSIRANQHQPRHNFDEEALDSLTASIRETGVLQPVLVREVAPGAFELIAGERRWRAATRAGLATIPALVRTADEARSLEEALVENLHRQDLGPLEEAAAYRQLQEEFGLTQDQVATRVGKSRSAVANTLRLLQLSPSVQRLLAEGRLSAGHARALLGAADRKVQEGLARRVVSDGLSVRQLEEEVRGLLGDTGSPGDQDAAGAAPADRRAPRPRSAAVLELEDLLAGHLDTRVHVTMGGGSRGRVVLEFADLDDLERIYRVIVEGREPPD